MANGGRQTRLGSLLVKYCGQYYFIPADRVGGPLDLSEAEIQEIEKNVNELKIYPDDDHNVEFAIQMSIEETATSIRRRN